MVNLAPHSRSGGVEDLVQNLLAPVRRQTVQHDGVGLGDPEKVGSHRESGEICSAPFGFFPMPIDTQASV